LRELKNILGEKFVHGVVIYLGEKVIPFGEKLTALPVAALLKETFQVLSLSIMQVC